VTTPSDPLSTDLAAAHAMILAQREMRHYVRDDRPFGGKDPPAAVFRYSRTRAGEHPQEHLAGYVMQADAFAGFNPLYDAKRRPAPRPIAIEAVRRIDELFEIERTINGLTPQQRVAVRQAKSKPLVGALEGWLRIAACRCGGATSGSESTAPPYPLRR
jgi:hypothetical protein